MIDYVRLLIRDAGLSKYLLSGIDTLFDTHSTTATTTAGRETINVDAMYNGLRFKITESGVVIIDGSFHKTMNKGIHNYNNFSYGSLLRVVADLCTRFSIDPHRTIVQNVEIGVNVNSPFDPQEFTDRCAFLFSGAGVTRPSPIIKGDSKGFDKGIRFNLSEYAIKIYNKGAQYNQQQNILRIEYKSLKSRAIEKAGIKTLYDLCSISKLNTLVNDYLLDRFNCILVDEIVDAADLNNREQGHYFKRLDYVSWRDTKGKQRVRNKDYIKQIYHKHSQSDFKTIVGGLIESKSQELLTLTMECVALLTAIKNTKCPQSHLSYNRWDHGQFALAA